MAELTEINFSHSATDAPDTRPGWTHVTGIRSGVHIWTLVEADKPPITNITIAYDNEVPDSEHARWQRVNFDLSNGGPRPVWLYYATGGASSPIVALKVVTDRNPIAGPGFSKEAHVLNPDTPRTVAKEFLCYQTTQSAAKASRELYRVGDILDVRDQMNEWRVARIIDVNEQRRKIRVTFVGWSSRWDEDHSFRSETLAPYRSKTRGSLTGWTGDVPAWNYNAAVLEKHLDMFSFVPAQLAEKRMELTEDDKVFLEGEATQTVKNLLSIDADEKDFESVQKRDETLAEIVKYFCNHLDLGIYLLQNVPVLPEDAMGNITRILGADARYRRFFKLFGAYTPGDYDAVMEAGKDYVNPEAVQFAFDNRLSSADAPKLAQYLIAYFGKQGGFQALQNAMKNTTVIFDFYSHVQLLSSLFRLKRVSMLFFAPYLLSIGLPELLHSKIAAISDGDLKQLNRAYFDSLFTAAAELDLASQNVPEIRPELTAPFVDKMRLEVASRMLSASVLESRALGLDQIEELARYLLGGVKPKKNATAVFVTISKEALGQWIQSKNVLERVFGRDPHEYLIKRVPFTLVLLAHAKMLRPSDMTLLWRIATSERGALSRAGLALLGETAVLAALDEEQYADLLTKIKEVPKENLTGPLVEFAAKFTEQAVAKHTAQDESDTPDDALSLYAADYFWNLLMDESVYLHQAVRSDIQRTFTSLVTVGLGARRKRLFMRRCVANLKDPKVGYAAKTLSLQLLHDFIQAGPASVSAIQMTPQVVSDYIVKCDAEFGLIELLINDLESCIKRVSQAIAENAANAANAQANPEETKTTALSPTSSSLANAQPDVEDVAMRTRFLGYLLSKSALQLTVSHTDKLWNAFIRESTPLELRNYFFRWLNDSILNEVAITKEAIDRSKQQNGVETGFAAISVAAVIHLYETYCVHLKAADMTDAVLDLFLRLLVEVNCELIGSVETRNFIVVLRDDLESLHGLDLLWELAFYAPSNHAASRSAALIVDLFTRLSFEFPFEAKAHRIRQYVTKVLDVIKQNKLALESPDTTAEGKVVAERAVRRGISALKGLIQNAYKIMIPCAIFAAGDRVYARWQNKSKIYPAKIRAVNNDGTYNVDYDDGDKAPKCPARNVVDYLDPAQPVSKEALGYADELYNLPSKMITGDPINLDLFLSIVEAATEYPVLSTLALDLLNSSPYSEQFVAAFAPRYIADDDAYESDAYESDSESEGEDEEDAPKPPADRTQTPLESLARRGVATPMAPSEWAKIFPPSHTGRLVYALKFMIKMLRTSDKASSTKLTQAEEAAVEAAERRRDLFKQSFAARGGIQALANVLLHAPYETMVNSRVGLSVLKDTLRFFDLFLRSPDLVPLYESIGAIDYNAILPRVIGLINAAVAAQVPPSLINAGKTNTPGATSATPTNASDASGRVFGPQLPGADANAALSQPVDGVMIKDDTEQLVAEDQKVWLLAPGILLRFAMLFVVRNWTKAPSFVIELVKSDSNQATQTLFPTYKSWTKLFTAALLDSPLASLREVFARSIPELITALQADATHGAVLSQNASNLFTKIMLEIFPAVCARPAGDELIRYYFSLLDKLLQTAPADLVDFGEFGRNVLQRLLVHPIVERPGAGLKPKQQLDLSDYNATAAKGTISSYWGVTTAANVPPAEEDAKRETEAGVDLVLVGLYNLARRALQSEPQLADVYEQANLVDAIYKDVFELPVPDSSSSGLGSGVSAPKCKSPQACRAAFDLLAAYCQHKPETMTKLVSLLAPLHMAPPRTTLSNAWSYSPQADETRSVPYLGLNNMGATCYINSTLQQLFMIPHLRQNILEISVNTDLPPDGSYATHPAADPKNELIVRSLRQLQMVMASLQESNLSSYNPAAFIHTLTDSSGAPLNPSIQEDSATFMVRLIDNLNKIIKGSPYEDHINRSIGGVYANELIGMNSCPHVRTRPDEFVTIPLEVRGMNTLEEALRTFVKPEVLEGDNGFRCDQCKAKVDTMKRSVIQHLPQTLCFQLKRFDMCFETFRTIKLDDRLEFPEVVDMKPYTVEGVPLDPRLKDHPGYVPGTVDGKPVPKHADDYYQYKLRGVIVHYGTADGGHYYSYIQERLPRELEAQGKKGRWFEFNDSFVRPFDPEDLDEQTFGGETEVTSGGRTYRRSNANAYMLFYDRIGETKPSDCPDLFRTKSTELKTQKEESQDVLSKVWQANQQQWRDRSVFNPAYFSFMADAMATALPRYATEAREELLKSGLTDADLATGMVNGEPSEKLQSFKSVAQFNAALTFSFRFIFLTVARARRNETLTKWQAFFPQALAERAAMPFCAWMLASFITRPAAEGAVSPTSALSKLPFASRPWAYQMFLTCPTGELRQAFAALVDAALKSVFPHEIEHWKSAVQAIRRRNLIEEIVDPETDDEENYLAAFLKSLAEAEEAATVSNAAGSKQEKATDGRMAEISRASAAVATELKQLEEGAPGLAFALWMLDNFREIGVTWRNAREYPLVLQNIASMHPVSADLVNQSNMIARACDLYIGNTSPIFAKSDIPLKSGAREKLNGIEIHYLFSLIATLAPRAPTRNRRSVREQIKQARLNSEQFLAARERATRRVSGELLPEDEIPGTYTKEQIAQHHARIREETDTLLIDLSLPESSDEQQVVSICVPPTTVPGHEDCYTLPKDAWSCLRTYFNLMMTRYLYTRTQALQLQTPDVHLCYNNMAFSDESINTWFGFLNDLLKGPHHIAMRCLFRMLLPIARIQDVYAPQRAVTIISRVYEVVLKLVWRTWLGMDMFFECLLRFAAISETTYLACIHDPQLTDIVKNLDSYETPPPIQAPHTYGQRATMTYGADVPMQQHGLPMSTKLELVRNIQNLSYAQFMTVYGEAANRRYPHDPNSVQTPTVFSQVASSAYMQDVVDCDSDDESIFRTRYSATGDATNVDDIDLD